MADKEKERGTGQGGRGGRGARGGGERASGGADRGSGGERADRGGGERRERRRERRREEEREELDERVVDIRRVAKVIKGGRRFAYRTVVVVGDNKGRIGIGIGKARAVPDSIRKATEKARAKMEKMALVETTIPFAVTGEWGGATVLLKPAAPGTGIIAAGGVRAVLEATGVRNILTKSQGSNNLLNVAMATMSALRQLRSPEQTAAMRDKPVKEVRPVWMRRSGS